MALTRITIRQIEAVIAVADTASFKLASERLGMTAQAISQLVAEFENQIGFAMFHRTTRHVELSGAGKALLPFANTTLRRLQDLQLSARTIKNNLQTIVTVGAPLVLASLVLPTAIRDYRRQHPDVAIRIVDTAVGYLVDGITQGDFDLAVGPDRERHDAVQARTLFNSRWVLWCAREHPLATAGNLSWSDLEQHAVVAASRDYERNITSMAPWAPASASTVPPEIVDNITTALGIAASGEAVTLAPE
ncbi:MAG: LysR family transcriptional regulator, partial [Thiothrix sp.]|nr:LysR family transcriptional regulator [Thiothrix sp.]